MEGMIVTKKKMEREEGKVEGGVVKEGNMEREE